MDCNQFLQQVTAFAAAEPQIESVLLVGSYARGTQRTDSDIDLVILTARKADMAANPQFTGTFGPVSRQQAELYGACTSIRVWYTGGPEVEFGLVEPGWAADPLDAGTRQVLADGYIVLYDAGRHFENRAEDFPPPIDKEKKS